MLDAILRWFRPKPQAQPARMDRLYDRAVALAGILRTTEVESFRIDLLLGVAQEWMLVRELPASMLKIVRDGCMQRYCEPALAGDASLQHNPQLDAAYALYVLIATCYDEAVEKEQNEKQA